MKHLSHIFHLWILPDRTILLITLFLIIIKTSISAQLPFDTTLYIPEVIVKASRVQQFRDDIKTDVFSFEDIKPFTGESLGRFLIARTALNVKSYGSGGALANISLRGSSTNHVQVNWNGFPINSVTLGSCDFSMIPAAGFDRISVVYSASGALYGSGTFGGAINLDNNLEPGKAFGITTSLGYESLNTLNGSTIITSGNENLAWKGNLWGAISENEFNYFDYIRQRERKQTDGNWSDIGTIQQAVFRLSPPSTLETGIWFQVKKYNIPSRIGTVSYESQKDSTIKFFAAYNKSQNRWGFKIKTAVFSDYQRYIQKASEQATSFSIDSKISSRQFYGDANFRYYLSDWISFDAGITGSLIFADVSAYGEIKEEKGIAVFSGIKFDRNGLTVMAEIRKEINTGCKSSLLPSLGIAWEVIPDKYTVKFNVSKKFRKPSFNDLFWLPGGNPQLVPESGYSAEAGSAVTLVKGDNLKLTTDIVIYGSVINNMIVWRPAGTYWSPENYRNVNSAGMEGGLMLDLTHRKIKFHSSMMIMLNKSRVGQSGSEEPENMLYSPRIITSFVNQLTAGIFDLMVVHHFTADRFYDENSLLKPYQTVEIQAGAGIPIGKGRLNIHTSLNNLTNTTYELIRLYPMPGRYYSLKLNCSF